MVKLQVMAKSKSFDELVFHDVEFCFIAGNDGGDSTGNEFDNDLDLIEVIIEKDHEIKNHFFNYQTKLHVVVQVKLLLL